MESRQQVWHELKTFSLYFDQIFWNIKKFELRKNDRDFQVGDFLVLREYDPVKQEYTGRSVTRRVTYCLYGGVFDLPEDMVIMSIDLVW